MPRALWAAWPFLRGRIARAEEVVLLLDYDGTLTPIVKHPSRARLSAGVKRLLKGLVAEPGIWVAVVSGRSVDDLKKMIKVPGLCYVGNHGLELEGPKMSYLNPAARRSRQTLRKIYGELKKELRPIKGAWVEDKGLTLSAHSRQVAPKEKLLLRNAVYGLTRPYQEKKLVRVTSGKEVFEVRPPVHWDKGKIVRWLLARRESLKDGEVVAVYVGDDLTDEDAFEALGKRGITVAVGPSDPLTRAAYGVKAPSDVKRLLRLILGARRSASSGEGAARAK